MERNLLDKLLLDRMGVGCESVRFDEFISAVQLDLNRLSYHTTLSAQREDGLRNRRCAAA